MFRLFAFIIFSIACTKAQAIESTIYLSFKHSTIRAEKSEVLLKDLLVIETANRESNSLINELESLNYIIKDKLINANEVILNITKKVKIQEESIVWRGSKQVKFKIEKPLIETHEITKRIKEFLVSFLKDKYDSIEVELVPQKNNDKFFFMATDFRVKNIEQINVRKRTAVWIELIKDDKVISEVPVWFQMKAYAKVLTAIEDIGQFESLDLSQLTYQLIEVTGDENKYFYLNDEINNLWTTKKLVAGAPLQKYFVAQEPLIKKNQDLLVEYKRKFISIETTGKAMSHGFLGDSILILLEGSRAPIAAKIIANNKVKVVVLDA